MSVGKYFQEFWNYSALTATGRWDAWKATLKTPFIPMRWKPRWWWFQILVTLFTISMLGRILDAVPLPVVHPFSVVTVAELLLMLPVMFFAAKWGWVPGLVASLNAATWWYRVTPYYDEPQVFANFTDGLSVICAAILFFSLAFLLGAIATHTYLNNKRLSDALQRYRDLNEQKEEFLSIIAHELRTPLTSASIALQLTHRVPIVPETVEESIARRDELRDVAEQQTQRMSHMLDDITDAMRASTGKLSIDASSFDLGELTQDSVRAARILFNRRVIDYRQPRTAMFVSGDSYRIAQVLHNFLSNAAKFSPDDEAISVTVHQDGLFGYVTVRDNGMGIPYAQQEDVWKRFVQLKQVKSQPGASSYIGFGVGLYVAKTLIEMMGGQVGVRSAPGAGSAFWFALPLVNNGDTPAGMPRIHTSVPSILAQLEDTGPQSAIANQVSQEIG